MKILIYFIFFSYFLNAEDNVAFYVMKKNYPSSKKVFKLSLDKKKAQELEARIKYYNGITKNTNEILNDSVGVFLDNHSQDIFSDYSFVMYYSFGDRYDIGVFEKFKPFSFEFIKLDKSKKLIRNSDPRLIEYYSIEEFFTPEDKAKMIELIPEWSPENIKKREEERKKEELEKAKRKIATTYYIKEGAYYKEGKYVPAKEIFKLSLDKKRTLELLDKIDDFKEIKAREIGYTSSSLLPREVFSKYELIGVDERGKEIDWNRLFYGAPFSLEYESKKKSLGGNKIEAKYYSIEDFFTPEEKKKMLELIPLWKAGKEKEREEMKKLWQDGWDEHAKTFGVKEEATLSK